MVGGDVGLCRHPEKAAFPLPPPSGHLQGNRVSPSHRQVPGGEGGRRGQSHTKPGGDKRYRYCHWSEGSRWGPSRDPRILLPPSNPQELGSPAQWPQLSFREGRAGRGLCAGSGWRVLTAFCFRTNSCFLLRSGGHEPRVLCLPGGHDRRSLSATETDCAHHLKTLGGRHKVVP